MGFRIPAFSADLTITFSAMSILNDIAYFISDWDETITESDSMHLIGKAAYSQKPSFEPEWSFFANAYMEDYMTHKKAFESEHGHLNGLEKELKFQTNMAKIEQKSVERVEGSELFKGIPVSSIRRQSEQVTIRSGWWKLAAELRKRGVPIAIVSVNWSGEMIREAFRQHGYVTDDPDSAKNDVTVFANEIALDDNGIATGKLSRLPQDDLKLNDLRTGCDKKHFVAHIKAEVQRKSLAERRKVIYCGDSGTDFLALLEADVGIVVAKIGLIEKFEEHGVKVQRLPQSSTDRNEDSRKQLYYIKDWNDILPA